MSIDLGNAPIGTPPTNAEKSQIRSALGFGRPNSFELFGVIRNVSGTWAYIDDANHAPYGLGTISQSSATITIPFTLTASKVGSFIVVPDETFAQRGLIAGASVGLSSAVISLNGQSTTGYIQWNGTQFTHTGSVGITSITFSGSEITVNHVSAGNANVAASILCQSHNYFIVQTGCNPTQTRFRLVDPVTGMSVTSFPSGLNIWFNRQPSGLADPSIVTSSNGNLWLYGIMYS